MTDNTRRIRPNDPFFIGFDSFFNNKPMTTFASGGWPPYNVIKVDEEHYKIELAVAGIEEDEIDISSHGQKLVVSVSTSDRNSVHYVHKGIAERSFKREFTLAPTIVVNGADLRNGILTINLKNVIPEDKKEKKIKINSSRSFLKE